MEMHTLDKVLAPLRGSRAAIVPYVESIQSGYHEASDKARALVRHPPKAARMLANRYVLISLVAGACVFAANRWRHWRNNHPHTSARRQIASRARSAATKTSSAARKGARAAARATRVH
jgi:hypothetical protein